MGRFRNTNTDVVINVDDSKDDRYGAGSGWESDTSSGSKSEPKKSTSSKK